MHLNCIQHSRRFFLVAGLQETLEKQNSRIFEKMMHGKKRSVTLIRKYAWYACELSHIYQDFSIGSAFPLPRWHELLKQCRGCDIVRQVAKNYSLDHSR
jgi:hypothetical protein